MSDESAPEGAGRTSDPPDPGPERSIDHAGESDLYPIVEMPSWVAPAIGVALVVLAALAVWFAR